MSRSPERKLSLITVSMIIVIATFGFSNVIDNLVELGLAAIPSWFAVGMLYFLPLGLILAEFSADNTESRGGIYSFVARVFMRCKRIRSTGSRSALFTAGRCSWLDWACCCGPGLCGFMQTCSYTLYSQTRAAHWQVLGSRCSIIELHRQTGEFHLSR